MKDNKNDSSINTSDLNLASYWNFKFKDAMVSKADYTKRWQMYEDAYKGDYFKNDKLPEYKSNLVSNYIFSVVETIRPIMLDNDPKFQSMPRQPDGMQFSNDLQEAFMFEWDRERVNIKLYRELITTLVTGTSVFFIPWDSEDKNVKITTVSPKNLFPDPLATCVEDAEYIIYASYKNKEVLKRLYPEHSNRLQGGQINYSELVNDNDRNSRVDNQVLVLEVWTKDYEVNEEIKGKVKKVTRKYPNGRVITLCPELGIVLDDKENPYKDGRFPFVLFKDYDVPGKFWGEGEVAQLLSPQKHMNDLNNAVIDSAKATANMPWIIDKNAGIKEGSITARPGLIIRKNPGTDVKRDQPPSMPMYVVDAIEKYKLDIEQVSGIYSSVKGNSATGVYTAQGILALQEAGQTRIRLKVKLLEESLAQLASLWYSRMKQFWKESRWVRITKADGSYDMKAFTTNALKYDYDIRVTAGSTMPVNRGAMLDLMIRLAQTQMPDGQPLVDREAVVQYLPEEIKASLMERMGENQSSLANIEQAIQETQQMVQELGGQLQQVAEEGNAMDEQQMVLIEEVTTAVEELSGNMETLQGEYDKVVKEKEEEEKLQQIRIDSYNKGFMDAEGLYEQGGEIPEAKQNIETPTGVDEVPDEMLSSLESMSDDELALMMEQNPNLMDLL